LFTFSTYLCHYARESRWANGKPREGKVVGIPRWLAGWLIKKFVSDVKG